MDPVGQVRGGVPQVLALAGHLLRVHIHQHQLIRDALDGQGVRHVGAHMAQTHNADFSRFHITFPPVWAGDRSGPPRRLNFLVYQTEEAALS